MVTQNALCCATPKHFDAIRQGFHDSGIVGELVTLPDEPRDLRTTHSRFGISVHRPTGLGFHRREEPRVVVPHVGSEFGLVVIRLHVRLYAAHASVEIKYFTEVRAAYFFTPMP